MAPPTVGTLPEVVISAPGPKPDYRVSLTRAATAGTTTVERVIFDVSPEFRESRQVLYKNIDPLHAPGGIYQYASTASRTFSIEAKLIARSINEATRNLAYIQYLRAWAMPVFGSVGNNAPVGEDILGAPPAVLLLTAYSPGKPKVSDTQKTVSNPTVNGYDVVTPTYGSNIYNIPVVITSLDIPFPCDVDYIPTVNSYPVPMVTTVSILLVETHSPNKYSGYNLQDFKNGSLINF